MLPSSPDGTAGGESRDGAAGPDQTVDFGVFNLCCRRVERVGELPEALGGLLDFAVGVSGHCSV
jgi:hypothetical protein